ncbi:MAG: Double zinc ribbon domain [Acidobacteriota bacterium]|nr:Double zinc ribbon domain [Acidobacteriota bacterium]
MPELALPATCANHPGRPAMAICVACRKRICPACATPWEGRQYCADCLAERRAAARPDRAGWGWAGMALAASALLWAVTWLRPLLAGLFAGLG